mgnify:CR=1 FL=1
MNGMYKIGLIGLGSIGTRHLRNIPAVLRKRNNGFTIDLIRSGKGKEPDKEVAEHVNQIFYSYDSKEYADIYDHFDLVVGGRVHGIGKPNTFAL